MEQEWYCTIIGVEFGPVAWDDVVQMVADGQLSGDDTIRQGSTGEWRPAREISGLFEQAEAALAEFTDLSELMVVSESAASRPKARPAARPPSRPAPPLPEEWYFQSLGHVLGPCSYDRLVEMARTGELHPADPIRPGADSEWQAAGSMPGLFPAHVLAAAAQPAPAAARPKPAPAATAPAPVQAPPAAPVYQHPQPTDREWYTWLLGREFGPLTLLELRDMLAMGKLAPHEPVRYGAQGQWVPAQSCDILFGPLPTAAPPEPVAPEYVPEPEPPAAPAAVAPAPAQPGSTPEISAAQLAAAMPAAMDGNKELVRQLLELLKQEGGVAGYQATHSQNDAQWYCQIKGQEMGPLSIDVIAQMTVQKRILPTDLLRSGTSGEWFPASSVEQLFPSSKAKSAAINDEAMFGRLEKLFEESQTDGAARREQAAAAAAATGGGPKKTEASRSAAGNIIRNMNSNVLREAEAQKQRAKQKAAGDSIGQQLKDHPREVAILAVIAIAGLIYWFSPSLLTGLYAGSALTKFEAVLKQEQAAHDKGGGDWESKAKSIKEDLDVQIKRLGRPKRGTAAADVLAFGKKVKSLVDSAGLPKKEGEEDAFTQGAKDAETLLKKAKKKLGRK